MNKTSTILKWAAPLLFFVIMATLSSCHRDGITEGIGVFNTSQQQLLTRYINQAHRALPLPGISVAIVKDDSHFCHGTGTTAVAKGKHVSDTTIFSMGNISELMITTAILKLAESRKISLDDPVIKHLPYFKVNDDRLPSITIRHLLSHRSGIPHHAATWDLPSYEPGALEMTTRSIEHQALKFAPGTQVARAQYEYDILADLIGKVTGKPFEDYLQHKVFAPLGMKHSTFYHLEVAADQLALPHNITDWLRYELTTSEVYPFNREYAGSTGFHSCARDMSRWMYMILHKGKTHLGEPFLQEESIDQLLHLAYQTGPQNYVGLGWEIEKIEDILYYKKSFNQDGFCAELTVIPSQHTGVLVQSHISGDFNPAFMNTQLLGYLQGKELHALKTPIAVEMGRKFDNTQNLDSAFHVFHRLKATAADQYSFTQDDLSQLGVNFLFRHNDIAHARAVFEFSLRQFPTSPDAYLNLAEAYLLSKEWQLANKNILKAKSLRPVEDATLRRLAYLETNLKENQDTAPSILN